MVWKGHNYGLCKKCGKIHINPFLGKKHTVESKFKMSQKIKTARSLKKWSAWNKGLTKETDERVKKYGKTVSKTRTKLLKEGKLFPWNKGLTEKTDVRVWKAAEKERKQFESGERVIWCRGLTKETSEGIRRRSKIMSDWHQKHPNFRIYVRNKMSEKGRKGTTYIELLMAKILDSAQVEYHPQHPVTYISKRGRTYTKFVDFYLPNHKLCIECDGEEWHKDKEADNRRDEIILSVLGSDWRIEHISGKEIFEFAKFFGFRK